MAFRTKGKLLTNKTLLRVASSRAHALKANDAGVLQGHARELRNGVRVVLNVVVTSRALHEAGGTLERP